MVWFGVVRILDMVFLRVVVLVVVINVVEVEMIKEVTVMLVRRDTSGGVGKATSDNFIVLTLV